MAKISILIVDNNEDFRESLKDLLSIHGYKCETADSPEKAIEMLAGKDFQLALVDIRLQTDDDPNDASGISVVKWLSSTQRQTKAIMLTAYMKIEFVKESLMSGAVDYVSKSEGPTKLIARIQRIMKPT